MSRPISVIIRTKNESKYLGRVLHRLKEQDYTGEVEMLLVDSGSTDDTVSIAERYGCRIITVRQEEFSFGRALNVGIEDAKGEVMIHLSGHSVPVNEDYFTIMVEPFADSSVAATFGRDIPWPEACPSQARDILNHFPETGADGSKFSNANAAIRKSIWHAIRFDENLAACEDLFWAKEVMCQGYRILYVPRARVYHSHTSSCAYMFERYFKERSSVKPLLNLPDVELPTVARNCLWQTKMDFRYVRKHGYSRKWYFHIPLYRLSQELGLYFGSRAANNKGRQNG
jgi:glycosyltransferase involved in cell wall biosynthesis